MGIVLLWDSIEVEKISRFMEGAKKDNIVKNSI